MLRRGKAGKPPKPSLVALRRYPVTRPVAARRFSSWVGLVVGFCLVGGVRRVLAVLVLVVRGSFLLGVVFVGCRPCRFCRRVRRARCAVVLAFVALGFSRSWCSRFSSSCSCSSSCCSLSCRVVVGLVVVRWLLRSVLRVAASSLVAGLFMC